MTLAHVTLEPAYEWILKRIRGKPLMYLHMEQSSRKRLKFQALYPASTCQQPPEYHYTQKISI